MLEVSGLESRYGRIPALKGIDLAVRPGELVALVGANGAGKTTLLRTLSGVQPASAGHVRYEGADITATAPERRVRMGIVQVPEGRQMFGPLSVEDNLRLGAYTRRDREAVRRDMQWVTPGRRRSPSRRWSAYTRCSRCFVSGEGLRPERFQAVSSRCSRSAAR